jgi:hypothetical protein
MVLAAFGGGFAAQTMLGTSVAHAQERGDVVRATAFVLVDDEGRERGSFSLVGGMVPAFTVLDAEGLRRLLLGELEDGSGWGLRAYDEEGVNRMTVGLWKGAASGMRVFDGDGAKRLGIGWSLTGDNGGLALIDANGQERIGVGMGPGGGGDFVARDALGNDLWRALGEVEPPELP